EVEAVEQGTRKPRLILRRAALVGLAFAGEARRAGVAAAAGIHRRDELKARGIDGAMIGARDRDLPRLERLAQGVERLRLELGQLVQEQHAVVRERNLAGPRLRAAADERRHGGGVVRRAKRTPIGELAAGDLA